MYINLFSLKEIKKENKPKYIESNCSEDTCGGDG